MARGGEEIAGGISQSVRESGGEALRLQLATLMAGHRVDHVIWALIEEMVSIGLVAFETREGANAYVDQLRDDILNGFDLNWNEPHRMASRAAFLRGDGEGSRA